MAQEIDKIIKSTTPPKSKDVLWDNGKELLINRNGKWEKANSGGNEEFKDWSGAANFLNNENTPGGMINMPFGYENLNWSARKQIYYTPSNTPTLIYDTFEYNGFFIKYGNDNLYTTISIYDIIGIENAKYIGGPVAIYSEIASNGNKLLYAVTIRGSYYPSNIYIIPFSYNHEPVIKKLPLEFTTPYIVGNDTQEHLDELYRRLNSEENFVSNVRIKTGKSDYIIGLGIFNHTYQNNWFIRIIRSNTSTEFVVLTIGGINGQNLKELIVLNITDDSLIIEESNLVPTPDWNAQEGEPGYIENKPFGIGFNSVEWFYDDRYIDWCLTPMISNKVKYEGVIYEIPDYDDEPVSLGDGSIALVKYPYYDANLMHVTCYGIQDTTDERLQNILFEVNVKLDEQYLPDTIARTEYVTALEARIAALEAKLNS